MRTNTSPVRPVSLSVLSCAYNEEKNISNFLSACLDSKGSNFDLTEVVVVASGCTDRTEEIVLSYQKRFPKVRLISQPERGGKDAALVEGLRQVSGDVVLVENADTIPAPQTFDTISAMFRNPELGLVGTHPVPVSDDEAPTYRLSKMMWDLHDSISVNSLKLGEAYALRTGQDLGLEQFDSDIFLSSLSHAGGVRTRYARDAVIWTRPPATFEELWSQRLRISRQTIRHRKLTGDVPSTWDLSLLLQAMKNYLREHPREVILSALAVGFEASARIVGRLLDAVSRSPLRIWRPILSTKKQIPLDPHRNMPHMMEGRHRDLQQARP